MFIQLRISEVHLSLFPRLQGPVSRKSRRLFGPLKPFLKLRPAYSVKVVFSYVVKGIKIKITAKFRASRRLRFEDTKRIISPEMRPKRFGTFEKRAPVSIFGYRSVHSGAMCGERKVNQHYVVISTINNNKIGNQSNSELK